MGKVAAPPSSIPTTERRAACRDLPAAPIGHGQNDLTAVHCRPDDRAPQLKESMDKVTGSSEPGPAIRAAISSVPLAREVYSASSSQKLGEAASECSRPIRLQQREDQDRRRVPRGGPSTTPFGLPIVLPMPRPRSRSAPALVKQLKPDGRLVIPVGDFTQDLMVVTKKPDGTTINKTVVSVRFVPLIRE